MQRATPDSPRVFKNDFLDLMSRTHWATVPVLWVPVCAFMLWHSASRSGAGWLLTLVVAGVGFVAWTLTEYWLHRTFFHWQPPGRLGERMHFFVHGVHHRWPKDKYRLVMPPGVSIVLYFAFLALFYPVLGATYVWAWHAGFVLGYVFYDVTHYYIHHASPKSRYGLRLKKNHMLHHFADTTSRFAVSNMVWDRVFGTVGSRALR